MNVTPSHTDKMEWSRLAQSAYKAGRNDIGHRYSAAASMPKDHPVTVERYDSLQEGYRSWLNFGLFPS